MSPLFPPVAIGFSLYAVADWVKNRLAPALKFDKSVDPTASQRRHQAAASQRRHQAAQLCAV